MVGGEERVESICRLCPPSLQTEPVPRVHAQVLGVNLGEATPNSAPPARAHSLPRFKERTRSLGHELEVAVSTAERPKKQLKVSPLRKIIRKGE